MNPLVRRFLLLGFAVLLLALSLVMMQISQLRASDGTTGTAGTLTNARELTTHLLALSAATDRTKALDFTAAAASSNAAEASLKTMGGLASSEIITAWAAVKISSEQLQAGRKAQERATANAQLFADATPTLFANYEQLADRLAQRNAPSAQIYAAAAQLVRLERLSAIASAAAGGDKAAGATLEREANAFNRTNNLLTEPTSASGYIRDAGAEALAKKSDEAFLPLMGAGSALITDAPALAALAQTLRTLKLQLATAVVAAQQQEKTFAGGANTAGSLPLYGLLIGVLGLLMVLVHVAISLRDAQGAESAQKQQDAERQGAILKLLDEITNLANGDLTGELTVTEDFTGNIADSLNYTVQTLRGLVGTINTTSVEIAAAASSTTSNADRMSKASEGQAREIVLATQAINAASRSLAEVAGRAEKLSEQAKNSVEVAHNGAATVGRTIQGMSTLREQIQDTAKRIKRLGESSQEIGNIIEFINDIAEQTNTLALNASIQAAMAGEAGRGFAVVADEVQRLAERAGSATRQIESLIKTIQADTQEAVTSMERSTANVVGGAKSAEEAGLALTRIESTSQDLARLMQEISSAARGRSADTTKLAGAMQGIREIAVQTSTTAQQTAESAGELNALSKKLRESVAGFTLPNDDVVNF